MYNTNKIETERINQNIEGDLALFLVPLIVTVPLRIIIINNRKTPVRGPSIIEVAGVIVTLKSSILSSEEKETRTFSAMPIRRWFESISSEKTFEIP